MQEQAFMIRSTLDIVTARMQVREAARRYGLSLTDQARISMAISSFASNLVENGSLDGSINIVGLQQDNRVGVKVIFRCSGITKIDMPTGNERWMVDEIDMQKAPGDILEVTLTKWSDA